MFLGYPWRVSRCKQCARLSRAPSRSARPAGTCPGSGIVNFNVISQGFRAVAAIAALACCVELAVCPRARTAPACGVIHAVDAAPWRCRTSRGRRRRCDEQITGNRARTGHRVPLRRQRQKWRALVGIDLDTKPGEYRLRIHPQTARAAATHRRCAFCQSSFACAACACRAASSIRRRRRSSRSRDSAALAEAYARVSPRKWSGAFVLPVDGKPTSNFGTRSYYNGQPRAPHAGVDFVGSDGHADPRGEPRRRRRRCADVLHRKHHRRRLRRAAVLGLRALVRASRESWRHRRADDDRRPGRCDRPRHRTTSSLERSLERRARRSALTCRRYRQWERRTANGRR